jgi:hypothetical protein
MTMPGFTAEASLGEVKNTYPLTLGYAEAVGMVLSQARFRCPSGCVGDSAGNCHCYFSHVPHWALRY